MAILKMGSKGSEVKRLQRRLNELGVNCGTVDGEFGSKTKAAVKTYQKSVGLVPDGEVGPLTTAKLYDETTAPVEPAVPEITIELTDPDEVHGTAKEMDWWTSGIQTIFGKGVTALITDVRTGLHWKEIRKAGSKHADVQPCTAADTKMLKKAYGGSWSWKRRPIWVTINGVNYAASMNGMPHGGSSVSGNNFPGHHCVHFRSSRTHGSNRVDENHQKAIDEALKAKPPFGKK